jgi:hypothetical protein
VANSYIRSSKNSSIKDWIMPLDPYEFRDFDNWQVYLFCGLAFILGFLLGVITMGVLL